MYLPAEPASPEAGRSSRRPLRSECKRAAGGCSTSPANDVICSALTLDRASSSTRPVVHSPSDEADTIAATELFVSIRFPWHHYSSLLIFNSNSLTPQSVGDVCGGRMPCCAGGRGRVVGPSGSRASGCLLARGSRCRRNASENPDIGPADISPLGPAYCTVQ